MEKKSSSTPGNPIWLLPRPPLRRRTLLLCFMCAGLLSGLPHSLSLPIAMPGPVKHLLLAKFKDSVTPDQQATLILKYAALPNSISAMKGFEWGTDISVENLNQGFTHVFISTFDSSEGRDEYLTHPDHVAFGTEFLATLDKVVVVDYIPTVTLKAP